MNALESFIAARPGGFLNSLDLHQLTKLDRLCPVLVRCGGCRFTCAAQDVVVLMGYVDAGGDYVRDISFPVGSQERAASWQPERLPQPVAVRPVPSTASRRPVSGSWGGTIEDEWRGDG